MEHGLQLQGAQTEDLPALQGRTDYGPMKRQPSPLPHFSAFLHHFSFLKHEIHCCIVRRAGEQAHFCLIKTQPLRKAFGLQRSFE